MLVVQCPTCSQQFQANENFAGHTVACPGCQQPIQVPALASTPEPTVPTAQPIEAQQTPAGYDGYSQYPGQSPMKPHVDGGNNKIVWILTGGAALLLAGILLAFLLMSPDKSGGNGAGRRSMLPSPAEQNSPRSATPTNVSAEAMRLPRYTDRAGKQFVAQASNSMQNVQPLIVVHIHDINYDTGGYFQERLDRAIATTTGSVARARAIRGTRFRDRSFFVCGPVTDPQATADAITWGKVKIQKGPKGIPVFHITVPEDQRPKPIPRIVRDAKDPNFYPVLLAHLKSPSRRHLNDAFGQLRKLEPDATKQGIGAALTALLQSADTEIQRQALLYACKWDGQAAIAPTIAVYNKGSNRIKDAAVQGLAPFAMDPRVLKLYTSITQSDQKNLVTRALRQMPSDVQVDCYNALQKAVGGPIPEFLRPMADVANVAKDNKKLAFFSKLLTGGPEERANSANYFRRRKDGRAAKLAAEMFVIADSRDAITNVSSVLAHIADEETVAALEKTLPNYQSDKADILRRAIASAKSRIQREKKQRK